MLYKFVHQFLAGKHTIFGRISDGMVVVKRIGLVETDPGDRSLSMNHSFIVIFLFLIYVYHGFWK